jgi:cathepsin B
MYRAFAVAMNFSERWCFKNQGRFLAIFSSQYSISCDTGSLGCNGGNRIKAWEFLQTTGTVSEYCVPFISGDGITGKCPSTCGNPAFSFIKYYPNKNSQVRILRDMEAVKNELMKGGPVTGGLQTYDDLSLYKSGTVYQPGPSARLSDKHAINIVGWGNEKGREYFIIQNSWGNTWGEAGKFNLMFFTFLIFLGNFYSLFLFLINLFIYLYYRVL